MASASRTRPLPSSTTSEGHSATNTVSFSRSNAHTPRVSLRTVAPAKLLACQSVEKRCTRQKVSCATSLIMRKVKRMMPLNSP